MNSKKEKLLRKINPKYLEMVPKLSSDIDSVVDLELNKSTLKEGAKKLMLRFFKEQEGLFKSISKDDGLELGDNNYQESYRLCQSISERLSLPFATENGCNPRKKYHDFKKKLEEQMAEKREEEYKKRVTEYNEWKNNQRKQKDDSLEQKKTCNEKKIGGSEKTTHNESEEEISEKCNLPKLKLINDDMTDVEAITELNEEDEFGDSKINQCSLEKTSMTDNGDNFADVEQTQESQHIPQNLLSPSLKFTLFDSQISKNFDDAESLDGLNEEKNNSTQCPNENNVFMNFQDGNDIFDLNDAFEFCSGKFPDNNLLVEKVNNNVSQINNDIEINKFNLPKENGDNFAYENDLSDESVTCDKETDQTDFLNLKRDTQTKEETTTTCDSENEKNSKSGKLVIDSDEEDMSDVELRKRKTKRTLHVLNFSDEEDETEYPGCNADEDNYSENSENCTDNDDDDDDDDGQRSVHYDSEENEVINPREFFEKEAELSESEWSGDEDERGLDELDAEAGDEDELDFGEIQSQLGKIHMRRLLDDDSKNVRLLQELFFEDGDLHTNDEYKKFKWRNLTNTEEEQMETTACEVNQDCVDSSDDEGTEDLKMRKDRLERQLLFEKMKEAGELFSNDDLFKAASRKLKVTSIKSQLQGRLNDREKTEKSQSATANSLALQTRISRGSFLARNDKILSRLAKVTSSMTDNVRGPKNSKNFVFATKSPEKVKSEKPELKRAMEELDSVRSKKKLKSDPSYCVPSILDLLG